MTRLVLRLGSFVGRQWATWTNSRSLKPAADREWPEIYCGTRSHLSAPTGFDFISTTFFIPTCTMN